MTATISRAKDLGDVVAQGLPLRLNGDSWRVDDMPTPTNADPSASTRGKCGSNGAQSAEPFVFGGTAEIFAELPETKWIARGVHLGPGRPVLLAGYGGSLKTLSVQQLALAVATGRPILDYFECVPGRVRHLDYEQGWHATAKRYQRLALGHGLDTLEIGDRLQLCTLPGVTLG